MTCNQQMLFVLQYLTSGWTSKAERGINYCKYIKKIDKTECGNYKGLSFIPIYPVKCEVIMCQSKVYSSLL
jgi:hypothetical protein